MVPGAGIEPARPLSRKILSLVCLPIPPPGLRESIFIVSIGTYSNVITIAAMSKTSSTKGHGGAGRNRTGVDGFAIRCMTTLPPRQIRAAC
jgi:hypothetical protein